MTSKAAPKVSKKAKDTTAKKAGPKLVTADLKGVGHNSGEKSPEAIKCLEELVHIEAQKKALAKGALQVRNRLKSEFGILSTSVARELALRKLDPDVRVQVETNHEDFKKMLGYQAQLDFVAGQTQPTEASAKAQPSEAELAGNGDEEGFEVSGEGEAEDQTQGQHEMPPVPENLRRPGVITREG